MASLRAADTVQSGTEEGNGERVAFDMRPEDTHQGSRSDMVVVWQTIPHTSSGN